MKTIMKYELVINEALRSALNYHTPDEQINEFIRFFGRHISSDRIYIFEDCKERHVTNNTYEWCAQGVVPEIDRLQNVDMDIIKWWYDTFSKGESIIITDMLHRPVLLPHILSDLLAPYLCFNVMFQHFFTFTLKRAGTSLRTYLVARHILTSCMQKIFSCQGTTLHHFQSMNRKGIF